MITEAAGLLGRLVQISTTWAGEKLKEVTKKLVGILGRVVTIAYNRHMKFCNTFSWKQLTKLDKGLELVPTIQNY